MQERENAERKAAEVSEQTHMSRKTVFEWVAM